MIAILSSINSATSSACLNYAMYQSALAGVFQKAIDTNVQISARSKRELHNGLNAIGNMCEKSVSLSIHEGTDKMRAAAFAVAAQKQESLQVVSNVASIAADASARVSEAVQRDHITALNEFRRFGLTAEFLKVANPHMAKEALMVRSRAVYSIDPNLNQVDRLGRKIVSDRYIQSVIRQAFQISFIESLLMYWALEGKKVATVSNPGKSNDGLKFSIIGDDSSLPSYDSIRDEAFHPNSTALVGLPS